MGVIWRKCHWLCFGKYKQVIRDRKEEERVSGSNYPLAVNSRLIPPSFSPLTFSFDIRRTRGWLNSPLVFLKHTTQIWRIGELESEFKWPEYSEQMIPLTPSKGNSPRHTHTLIGQFTLNWINCSRTFIAGSSFREDCIQGQGYYGKLK